MSKFKDIFIYRPLSVLGCLVALHTVVVGFGFTFVAGVKATPLYLSVMELMPPGLFGVVLMITGALCFLSYLLKMEKYIYRSTYVQTVIWIFITIAYLFSSNPFLAVQNALFWVLLSSYIAIAYGNRRIWVDNDADNVLR